MKKVLLIQGTIPHYRVPIFNELAKNVDLTVMYSYGSVSNDIEFKTLCIPTFDFRYHLHKKNIHTIAQNFDVVICMADFSYVYFHLMTFLPRKYKLIFWGIGVSASYNVQYDSNQTVAKRMLKFINKSDAAVFYCDYPVKKYCKMGVSKEKLFVANNTVEVEPMPTENKQYILFVGSLYQQKRIDILLENYLNAYTKNQNIHQLIIIGGGNQYDSINNWIKENGLQEKVILTGPIFDEKTLSQYFSKALICISPNQAGLSVLKSMGYGVPYVAHKNAITGGELFNIENGINGFLINDFSELETIILNCAENPDTFINAGEKAKQHYNEYRTVSHMVKGFTDAIDFVLNN